MVVEGSSDGEVDGAVDGAILREGFEDKDGSALGAMDNEGSSDGAEDGPALGSSDGAEVGIVDKEGSSDGAELGAADGTADGAGDCANAVPTPKRARSFKDFMVTNFETLTSLNKDESRMDENPVERLPVASSERSFFSSRFITSGSFQRF